MPLLLWVKEEKPEFQSTQKTVQFSGSANLPAFIRFKGAGEASEGLALPAPICCYFSPGCCPRFPLHLPGLTGLPSSFGWGEIFYGPATPLVRSWELFGGAFVGLAWFDKVASFFKGWFECQ